MTEFETGDL